MAAYTSAAGVAGPPPICSGGAYAMVPAAYGRSPVRTAIPKSVSLLTPSPLTSTFSGL